MSNLNQWSEHSRWDRPVSYLTPDSGVFLINLTTTPPFDSEEPFFVGHYWTCTVQFPILVHQCDYHDVRIQWSLMPVA